jgi:diacylglycerol kinase family enzyme
VGYCQKVLFLQRFYTLNPIIIMTSKKNIIFIINPISGTQSKRQILRLIDERVNRDVFDYRVVRTEYAGHAVEIARQAAADHADLVVAIGGDGTINEVGRSLVHTSTALGIIPCGSGNGLARHLHIPMDAKAAIDLINDYPTLPVLLHLRCGLRRLRQPEVCRQRQARAAHLP